MFFSWVWASQQGGLDRQRGMSWVIETEYQGSHYWSKFTTNIYESDAFYELETKKCVHKQNTENKGTKNLFWISFLQKRFNISANQKNQWKF